MKRPTQAAVVCVLAWAVACGPGAAKVGDGSGPSDCEATQGRFSKNSPDGGGPVGPITVAPAPAAQDGFFTAKRAYDFTDAVGVRVALNHANYIENWTAVKEGLTDLRVKYLRTSGKNMGTNAGVLSRVEELHEDLGVTFDFVFGSATQSHTAMEKSVDAALATGAALAFEGPNEWSKHYYNNQNDRWDLEVKDYQAAFRSYLRNNGWPTGPILCPAAWRRDLSARRTMDAIGIDDHCRIGNLHYYHRNTLRPTLTRGIAPASNFAYTSAEKTMDEVIVDQQGQKARLWVTETGESTVSGGDVGGNGVSPTVAAKYIPRLIAEFFKRGVPKVFIFELLDAAPGNYGLMDSNGNRRPAFRSLENVMTVLADPSGSSFRPDSIDLDFNGASGICSLVLQKRNGDFFVLLWKDVVSTDTDQDEVITFSWGFLAPTVRTYVPLDGAAAVNTWTNRNQIRARVSDHLLIVEIEQP